MSFRQKKNLQIHKIKTNNDFAAVTCKITNYMDKIEIGESITTEPFDLTVGGFITKWKIFFYPKGQYDYGKASKDYRVYVKLISCDNAEVETIKLIIKIHWQTMQMSSLPKRSVSHDDGVSMFIINDKRNSWAGPFRLQHEDNDTSGTTGNLIMECVLIENQKPSKKPKNFENLIFSPEVDAEIRKFECIFKK